MTIENFFLLLVEYRQAIALVMGVAPWLTYLICVMIPGQKEEPFLLSLNLALALVSMLFLTGYLAYATNTGGWTKVVEEANLLLLCLPPYAMITSLWLSKRRLPLDQIPAFRTMQSLATLAIIYLFLSWAMSKVRLLFFSYIPFSMVLWFLVFLLGAAYLAYRSLWE